MLFSQHGEVHYCGGGELVNMFLLLFCCPQTQRAIISKFLQMHKTDFKKGNIYSPYSDTPMAPHKLYVVNFWLSHMHSDMVTSECLPGWWCLFNKVVNFTPWF